MAITASAQPLLGRALTLDELREVTAMVRRIAAILLLEPELNGAYAAARAAGRGCAQAPGDAAALGLNSE